MPTVEIVQAEALAWLGANEAPPGTSVITSLPDVSELPGANLHQWRAWFVGAAQRVVEWVPPSGLAIFYQSDIRHAGVWIDKGYFVMRAAEEAGASLLWHKIACRKPPSTISFGRPSYSHMLCFTRGPIAPAKRPGPDVLPEVGEMSWSRAMGEGACKVALEFVRSETDTTMIVDPFCGKGSVLHVAYRMGFDVKGIDLSQRRCKSTRKSLLDAAAAS